LLNFDHGVFSKFFPCSMKTLLTELDEVPEVVVPAVQISEVVEAIPAVLPPLQKTKQNISSSNPFTLPSGVSCQCYNFRSFSSGSELYRWGEERRAQEDALAQKRRLFKPWSSDPTDNPDSGTRRGSCFRRVKERTIQGSVYIKKEH
jgi:hypothetical protein